MTELKSNFENYKNFVKKYFSYVTSKYGYKKKIYYDKITDNKTYKYEITWMAPKDVGIHFFKYILGQENTKFYKKKNRE